GEGPRSGGRLLAASGQELPERTPPTCVLRRLTELGQLEEHPPHQRLLLRAAAEEHLVRRVRDRAAHSPSRAIARYGEDAAVAAGPRLRKRPGGGRPRGPPPPRPPAPTAGPDPPPTAH